MRRTTFFITGTDTGVGKTVLTLLLTQYLRGQGIRAAALKPVCSGGRDDARVLHAVLNGALTLAEVNPWHFRAPMAPWLAARQEHRRVRSTEVLAHIRTIQRRFEVLLIEGAGGLLSPLGEQFDSRDLIALLHATPIIVCPNRLGVVNQVLLTLEALPRNARNKASVVLISPSRPDSSTGTNANLLAEFFDKKRIFLLPRLGKNFNPFRALKNPRMKQTLRALAPV
jgi:dethiobiotin synthetase